MDVILLGILFVYVFGLGFIKFCIVCYVIILRDLSLCNERERERGLNFKVN